MNGHGGNTPARAAASQWGAKHPEARVRYHDWWNSPRVMDVGAARSTPSASHASWMENFPWTRLPGVELAGREQAARPIRRCTTRPSSGSSWATARSAAVYEHSAEDMIRVWQGRRRGACAPCSKTAGRVSRAPGRRRRPDDRAEQKSAMPNRASPKSELLAASSIVGSRGGSRPPARGRSCDHRVDRHRHEEQREVEQRVVEEQRGPRRGDGSRRRRHASRGRPAPSASGRDEVGSPSVPERDRHERARRRARPSRAGSAAPSRGRRARPAASGLRAAA